MNCAHSKIESALDRWSECHWHIHQMEANYHNPDAFRYSLNSFIRAIKEVPQILKMELQNHPKFKSEIKGYIDSLKSDDLMSLLNKKRDFVVHQGMLNVLSKGRIAATEGRIVKISFGFRVEPWETTDEAYERFKALCRKDKSIRNLMGPDCDSWPMIRREWHIPEFPNADLLEVAINAWRVIGQTISTIVEILGGEKLDLSFSCRHDPERVKTKHFSQREFFQSVDGIDINA